MQLYHVGVLLAPWAGSGCAGGVFLSVHQLSSGAPPPFPPSGGQSGCGHGEVRAAME